MSPRRPGDDEIREELEFHREQRARRLRDDGASDPEASQEAARRFGNELKWQEETRRVHVPAWRDSLEADLRLAFRSMRRLPGFTSTAVLTMAFGIGAAAAAFSVVDPILFRDLPYDDPDELVSLGMVAPIERNEFLLGADYFEWKKERLPFTGMTTWSGVQECDLGGDRPQRLNCALVEWNFLSVLGARPQAGRLFQAGEDRPGAPRVALLSDRLWRSTFGADLSVVGRAVTLDGGTARVIGVLPADFELPSVVEFDMMVPQALDPAGQQRPRTGAVLRAFARLREGVSPGQAEEQMRHLFEASLQWVPAAFRKDVAFRVQGLRERQTRDSRQASWLLLATVTMVVLAACANLASLLLMRGTSRAREMAVRLALGARRFQLARLVLVETCVLTAAGGALGCGLAFVLLRAIQSAVPEGFFRLPGTGLDGRVLGWMSFVTLACALLAGAGPAWRVTRMRAGRYAAGHWLVVGQVAASVALLTLAGSLGREFSRIQATPMGLNPEHVSVARITLPRTYESAERRRGFFDQLEERLADTRIGKAALADTLPPAGPARTMIYSLVEVDGEPPARAEGTGGMVVWREVSPAFFDVLGVRMLEGRAFTAGDQEPGHDVMIASRALAKRLRPAGDLLGRRIRVGRTGPWRTVVGISADVRNAGLAPAQDPEYYLPRKRVMPGLVEPNGRPPDAQRSSWILLRTPYHHAQAAAWIEQQVHALDAGLPVVVEQLDDRIRQLSGRERFQTMVIGTLGALTLALACLGIAGAVGFLVARRTAEFGIRLALGAIPGQLVAMMLRLAAGWLLWGVPAGLLCAWGLARVLRTVTLVSDGQDSWPAVLAAVAVCGAGLAAAWCRARDVARLEPASVLRLNEER